MIDTIACNELPKNIPSYYDTLIIPKLFYNSVITRNIFELNNVIKYHPKLSIAVVSFYDLILRGAFFYKKMGKMEVLIKLNGVQKKIIIILF